MFNLGNLWFNSPKNYRSRVGINPSDSPCLRYFTLRVMSFKPHQFKHLRRQPYQPSKCLPNEAKRAAYLQCTPDVPSVKLFAPSTDFGNPKKVVLGPLPSTTRPICASMSSASLSHRSTLSLVNYAKSRLREPTTKTVL